MIKLDLWVRFPGEHQFIETVRMPAVPRVGEIVEYNSSTRVVHEVQYIQVVDTFRVKVLLK